MTQLINLDLCKEPTSPHYVYARVGDIEMKTITVVITDDYRELSLVNHKISFEGTVNERKIKVFDSENVNANNTDLAKGRFSYTFPSQAFSQAGSYDIAYFSVHKDGKRNTTNSFKILIDPNADIDAEEAQTVITEYNKLVEELKRLQEDNINQANKQIEQLNKDISELESKISTYEKNVKATADNATTSINSTKKEAEEQINKTTTEAISKLKSTEGDIYEKIDEMEKKLDSKDFYSKEEVEKIVEENKIIPSIGCLVYSTKKNYHPTQDYPNTQWNRFGKGRTIVSVDESDADFSEPEKTGGEKAHKLTNDELPTIYGSFAFHGVGTGTALAGTEGVFKGGQKNNGKYHTNASTSGADSYGLAELSFGGNKPHNNMQPYITAYVWVRVA